LWAGVRFEIVSRDKGDAIRKREKDFQLERESLDLK
jgi:hypothetical protein